jgi:hypothetical protein
MLCLPGPVERHTCALAPCCNSGKVLQLIDLTSPPADVVKMASTVDETSVD